MEFIAHCLLIAVIFAVVDSLWIGLVANKFYKQQLGRLLLDKPNFGPAIVFYAIAVVGMAVFVVEPALNVHSWRSALGHGALLGLVTYATYDLTNAATLKHWPARLTLVDMTWGTVVTAFATTVSVLILQ